MSKFAGVLLVGFAITALFHFHVTEGTDEKSTHLYRIQEDPNMREIFTANWAVEIAEGGDKMADKIARRYGFQNVGRIGGLSGVYHFRLSGLEKASLRTDAPYTAKSDALQSEPCVGFADQQVIKPRSVKSYMAPTDPLFQNQWNVLNSGQYGNEYEGNDLNVEKAWLQGLTGCNVTVTVVDDGLEFIHRDLWDNFVAHVSYDFIEEDQDPSSNFPWHGTSCGGIIGSVKNGLTCGVGIAYNTNLGGIALLGANSDMNEERALTLENSITDIYSNSWGPFDSGDIVDGPGRLTKLALQNGVREGRDGKGSIFVWANGNGGPSDDCAADGYASSIYTISIGAIGVDGNPSSFDEPCSAKMVVTYVTNSLGDSAVSTTDLGGECTSSFGGTSAATPMASGIIALALEANHNLTWRDVQYLIVYTSNPALTNSVTSTNVNGAIINGAGLRVSRQFGFGVMDAEAMVTRARHWINVPPQLRDSVIPATDSGKATSSTPFDVTIQYSGTIQYVEHVIVSMTVSVAFSSFAGVRGDIEIQLTSPSGTSSTLLGHREFDTISGGYSEWPFMSVMFWGENPTGEWNLVVTSKSGNTQVDVSDIKFQFFGVSNTPQAVANIPNKCHLDCARGCAKEGSNFCDACINLRNAYTMECIDTCPAGYTEHNGYCYNPSLPEEVCNSPLKEKEEGSCVDAGYVGCCDDGDCKAVVQTSPYSCFCDAVCYVYGDCCDDIAHIDCYKENTTTPSVVMPYIDLGVANIQHVPLLDDGISEPIYVDFPFGHQIQSTIYVGTNGYFTFDDFTGYAPFLFDETTTLSLVAPFFTDTDVSIGIGRIIYAVHDDSIPEPILHSVNSVINEHMLTDFNAEWILVAEWDNVPQFGSSIDAGMTNTFQGILATDFSRSFAVYTYKCGDLRYSDGATIGFVTGDGLFANHTASIRGSAQLISCLNMPDSPWVNVVYELSRTNENECEDNNGGCEHTCTDTFASFECSCRDGYVLNNDGVTCNDINECLHSSHGCEQTCINTDSSYTCDCGQGYVLDDNGRTCTLNCGGKLTEPSGSFHTPDWPEPYPSLDFRCEWVIDIENPTDVTIEITFDERYGIHGRDPCPTDYVEVLDGIDRDALSLGKYCYLNVPDTIYTSSNQSTIIFQASTNQKLRSRVGFSISYTAIAIVNECESDNGGCAHGCVDTRVSYTCSCNDGYILDADNRGCIDIDECSAEHGCADICVNTDGSYTCDCGQGYVLDDNGRACTLNCGGRLTEPSGSFHTPDWPEPYPSLDFRCEWVIDIENQTDVIFEITFDERFGIHGRDPCPTDYVQVLDGIDKNATSLGKYCNLITPDPIYTSSNQTTIIFQASTNQKLRSRVGFSVSYTAIPIVNECESNNGGCAQGCLDTLASYACSCNDGYILDVDNKGCIDIDECSAEHNCADICVNTEGSYACDCGQGYVLDDNGRTCTLNCGGKFTEPSGSFHTPDWPEPYPSLDFRCEWVIDIENQTDVTIEITFDERYGIHGRDPCPTDYIEIFDGFEQDSLSFGKHCLLTVPDPIITSTNKAMVIFQASTFQNLPSRVGAMMTYRAIPLENECAVDNGGCVHTCVDTLQSYTCSCNNGYTLGEDGHSCYDIDECSATDNGCEDICTNTDGSYSCSCSDGFALDSNGQTCSVSCGGILIGDSGAFQTPGWPIDYPQEDFICEWTMQNVSAQKVIRFEIDSSVYGINGRPPCPGDHIEFFNGLDSDSVSLGRFCKLNVPDPITVTTGAARVVFEGRKKPLRPASRKGVRVIYEVLDSEGM